MTVFGGEEKSDAFKSRTTPLSAMLSGDITMFHHLFHGDQVLIHHLRSHHETSQLTL